MRLCDQKAKSFEQFSSLKGSFMAMILELLARRAPFENFFIGPLIQKTVVTNVM